MGNTEYFDLCEISSKIRCPDCYLYWEAGIVYCTCGKCMQPSEGNRQLNMERYDVLSIPDYVIEKNPTNGARNGPSMRQYMYYKAHEMLKKARKEKKVVVTITFLADGTMMANTASLCQILDGLRNRSFNTMRWHWKTIPTLQQNKKEAGTKSHGSFL